LLSVSIAGSEATQLARKAFWFPPLKPVTPPFNGLPFQRGDKSSALVPLIKAAGRPDWFGAVGTDPISQELDPKIAAFRKVTPEALASPPAGGTTAAEAI
jgi:hypothetical protein